METGTRLLVFADSSGFYRTQFLHRPRSGAARDLFSVLRGYFARTKPSEPDVTRGHRCVLAIPAPVSAFRLRFEDMARPPILYGDAHRFFSHVDVFRGDVQRGFAECVAIARGE